LPVAGVMEAEDRINEAILWMEENGILYGLDEDGFEPETEITNEEMVVLIFNYQQFSDIIPPDVIPEEQLFIIDRVSEWAEEAVTSLMAQGLISTAPGSYFNPQGRATRADFVVMIYEYLDAHSVIES